VKALHKFGRTGLALARDPFVSLARKHMPLLAAGIVERMHVLEFECRHLCHALSLSLLSLSLWIDDRLANVMEMTVGRALDAASSGFS